MKVIKYLVIFALLFAVCFGAVAKSGLPFTVDNRLRLEWDDNIRQEWKGAEDESWKIIEQLQIIGDISAENTFVSVRYLPSYTYWDNKPGYDSSDLHHALDFMLNQKFSPRLTLAIGETLRYSELSELRATDSSDVIIRPDNTYLYNTASADLSYRMTTSMKLRASGEYEILSYDENDVSYREDYDIFGVGFDVQNVFTENTTAGVQLRLSEIGYDGGQDSKGIKFGDRSSNDMQIGGNLQQIFSPQLLGNVRAGYMKKEFDDTDTDDTDAPYGDASLTYLPSPRTRITLGGSYSLYEADVYPYANQTRTSVYGSLGTDVTGKIDFFVSGAYTMGEYKAEEAVQTPGYNNAKLKGGDDDVIQVSSRLRYNVYHRNFIELGYQYTDISSDVRVEYDRNRYWIGWQTRL